MRPLLVALAAVTLLALGAWLAFDRGERPHAEPIAPLRASRVVEEPIPLDVLDTSRPVRSAQPVAADDAHVAADRRAERANGCRVEIVVRARSGEPLGAPADLHVDD